MSGRGCRVVYSCWIFYLCMPVLNANPSIGIVEVIALCMPDRSSKMLSIVSKELTLTLTSKEYHSVCVV